MATSRPSAPPPARALTRLLALATAVGVAALGVAPGAIATASTGPEASGAGSATAPAATQTPTPTPDPSASPAIPVGMVTAELLTYPDAVVETDGAVRALVRVANSTARALDDAVVELALTSSPLADAAAVDAFVETPTGARTVVASTPVGGAVPVLPAAGAEPDAEPLTVHRLPSDESVLVAVTAAGNTLPLPADRWGVYGLTVTLATGSARIPVSTGVVTWTGGGIPELEMATVVAATGPGADLTLVTDSPDLRDVAIATDGTQLVGLDAGGVALSGRTVLRMPSYVPDVLSLAHAGDQSLLAYAVERARGADASATHDAPWISPAAALDAPTVSLLHSLGASAALLLTDGVITADGTPPAAVVRETSTGLPVLIPEPTLSSAVAAPATPESPAIAVAKAALVAAAATGPVLVSPAPGWLTGAADTAALAAVTGAPFVTALDVTALLTGDAGDAGRTVAVPTQAEQTAGDVSPAAVMGQAHRLERGNALAMTVEDPDAVLGPLGTMLLEPLTTSLRSQPERRDAALAGAGARAERLLGSLSVPAGSDINLIAAKGSVPVNVRNDLSVPATVVVDVTSFSPNLQIRNTPEVTVPAQSSMTVLIEVEAVSSADVNASIVLRNGEGTALGPSTGLSVRVRADWGNAVTAVFTVGLVLLLVMGVIRTVRRGRKDTRTGPRAEPEEATPGDDA